jgi:GGDEF domain-containing protein
LVFEGQNYGALAFESLKKNHYSKQDIAFIKKAVKLFTYYIYSFTNQIYLKNLIALDTVTLVLNKKEFYARLEDALNYEKTCEKYGIIALIKVDTPDEQQSLFDDKYFSQILKAIAGYIKEELKPNSFLGRIDSRTFAVYFFNNTINDATIWSEKVRKKIAQSGYPGLSNQIRYTVSIGLATVGQSFTGLICIVTVTVFPNFAPSKAL